MTLYVCNESSHWALHFYIPERCFNRFITMFLVLKISFQVFPLKGYTCISFSILREQTQPWRYGHKLLTQQFHQRTFCYIEQITTKQRLITILCEKWILHIVFWYSSCVALRDHARIHTGVVIERWVKLLVLCVQDIGWLLKEVNQPFRLSSHPVHDELDSF